MTTTTVAYGETTLSPGIRSRFVNDINGLTIHILEAGFEGKGRPCVLLLHGFPELAYSWRKVMLPLASAGFHVINIDNRDAGDSGLAAGPYSIADMADDAAEVLRAIDAGPAFVVGWSMGTFVSLELTIRHPSFVERLVLVAGSAGGSAAAPAAPEILALLARDPNEEPGARVRRVYPHLAAPGYMQTHPEDLEQIARSQQIKPMPTAAYYRQLGAISNWAGVGPSLAAIAIRTLVVHGELDPLIPFPNGEYIAAHVPGATLSRYPGVGHLPPIEADARFNREVLAFLA